MSKVKTTAVIAGTAPLPGATETPPPAEMVGGHSPSKTELAETQIPVLTPSGVDTPNQVIASPPMTEPQIAPGTRPLVASDLPPTPNRPGLETPQVTIEDKDPFVLIRAWRLVNEQGGITYRSLRATPVPGGCIVRHSTLAGAQLVESIAFVPGATILEGKLISGNHPL